MSTLIIPTRHKAKIPHTLSYPIGAKAISEALIGVPQFDQLGIDFRFGKALYLQTASGSWLPTYRVSSLVPEHLFTTKKFCVLQVQFSGPVRVFSPSAAMEEKGYYSPSWTITVAAVPGSLRHLTQQKLSPKPYQSCGIGSLIILTLPNVTGHMDSSSFLMNSATN